MSEVISFILGVIAGIAVGGTGKICSHRAVRVVFGRGQVEPKGGRRMALQRLDRTQQARIPVKYKNDQGIERPTENWQAASSDDAVAKASLNADGSELLVVSGANEGEVLVTVKADPKIGPDTGEITGVLTVIVNDGEATVIELQPGVVEPKP